VRLQNGNNDFIWRGRLVKAACPLFVLKQGDTAIAAHTYTAYSPQETINYVTSFDLKPTNYVLPHSPPCYHVAVVLHIFTNNALFIPTYALLPLLHIHISCIKTIFIHNHINSVQYFAKYNISKKDGNIFPGRQKNNTCNSVSKCLNA
jgi:hypothetical protein